MLPNRLNNLIKSKFTKLFKFNQFNKSTINQKKNLIFNHDQPYFTSKKFKIKKLTKAFVISLSGSYLLFNISSNYSHRKHLGEL